MCFVLGDVRPDAKSEYFRRRILPLWSAQAKGLRDIPSNSPIDIKEFQQRGEVSRCLEGGGVWKVSGGVCLERCVSGGVCLDRKVSGGGVSGQEGVWMVSGGVCSERWRSGSKGVYLEG